MLKATYVLKFSHYHWNENIDRLVVNIWKFVMQQILSSETSLILSQYHSDNLHFLITTMLRMQKASKSPSLVLTPDSDSSQVGKIPKPQVPEPRRISHVAKKMPSTQSQGGSSHWNHHKSWHWSHSCSQGLAINLPPTPPWVKLYWYKIAQFPLKPSRKPGPRNEPSV